MIIILGTKVRVMERSSGEFYCPKCNSRRPYKLKRYAKYFTLFFIPLFKIKTLGEQVECQKCFMSFKTKVLEGSPKKITTPANFKKRLAQIQLSPELHFKVSYSLIAKPLILNLSMLY